MNITGPIPSSVMFLMKNAKYIPGVLILENNRTYGRTANKKRLLYKCVPHNRHFPAFLVPYEITLGFSKSIPNKYVLFRFDSWINECERPHGLLVEVLGDVSNKNVFYNYQLYCRELRHSIAPFIRIVKEKTSSEIYQHIPHNSIITYEDKSSPVPRTPTTLLRRSCFAEGILTNITREGDNIPYVFSIDPAGSTDLDDAFSITPHPTITGNYIVSVYIANVFHMIETLDIWKSFSERVSTIYLPDQKLPLLPPLLSDNLCSLLENEVRSAFIMDVEITSSGNILKDNATFRTEHIKVSRNYKYESPELLANRHYLELLRISKLTDASINDSHDMVAFWMIQMNTICGSVLVRHNTGILRGGGEPNEHQTVERCINNTLDDSTKRFIQNWKHTNCLYQIYDSSTSTSNYYHAGLNTYTYAHISSPIRRLVDILNQTLFIHHLGLVESIRPDSLEFCKNWIERIDYINTSMKSIRKLQMDCELIHICENDPSLLNTLHPGIVFDKKCRNGVAGNGGVCYSYMVYLKDLCRVARVRSIVDYPEYTSLNFRLFFFTDEDNIRDKVRLQIT
jgi:hypothetical protein